MAFTGYISGSGGSGSVTIYTGDDVIVDPVRNVVISGVLNFLGGDVGIGIGALAGAKVIIHSSSGQANGTVISSDNINPTESIFQVRDAGTIIRLDVRANGNTLIDNVLHVGNSLATVSTSQTFLVKGSDNSFLTRNSRWEAGDGTRLMEIQNNGHFALNGNPTAGDRMFIVAGAGNDGAINISGFNLANNGYGILIQGGSGGANYSGILVDANGGSTGNNRAIFAGAGVSGPQANYGVYSGARNGSIYSIGVYGLAQGGDAINPSEFAAGIWADVMTQEADDRRAVNATISQSTNVNNAISYGMKLAVDYASIVANETVWGVHALASVEGAGVVNTAGFFDANGGSGATNNALITNNGWVVFGAASHSGTGSLVEVNGDLEIIGDVDGLFLKIELLELFDRVYLDNGNLLIEAA